MGKGVAWQVEVQPESVQQWGSTLLFTAFLQA